MSSFHLIPKIKPWVPQKHTIGCPMTQALDCGLPPNHPRLDSLDRLIIETPWVWATHLGKHSSMFCVWDHFGGHHHGSSICLGWFTIYAVKSPPKSPLNYHELNRYALNLVISHVSKDRCDSHVCPISPISMCCSSSNEFGFLQIICMVKSPLPVGGLEHCFLLP